MNVFWLVLGGWIWWGAWRYPRRGHLYICLFVLMQVLRVLVTVISLHTGSWLQAWATLVTSQRGSLLLWAALTAVWLMVTVGDDDAVESQWTRRVALVFLALLSWVEMSSVPPRSGRELAYPWFWLLLHPSAIFGSYAGQVLLLSWAVAALRIGRGDRHLLRQVLWRSLVLQITGVVVGSIWAAEAWGQYWSWDPLECFSLANIIWLSALTLSSHDEPLTGLAWSAALVPTYSLAATSLVRSGLLSNSSLHAYLPGMARGLPALCAGSIAALTITWLIATSRAAETMSQTLFVGTCLGMIPWFAGLAIALWPESRPALIVTIYTCWALDLGTALVRNWTYRMQIEDTIRKP